MPCSWSVVSRKALIMSWHSAPSPRRRLCWLGLGPQINLCWYRPPEWPHCQLVLHHTEQRSNFYQWNLSHPTHQLLGCHELLLEVGCTKTQSMPLNMDKQATIKQIPSKASLQRSKHVDIKIKFLKDLYTKHAFPYPSVYEIVVSRSHDKDLPNARLLPPDPLVWPCWPHTNCDGTLCGSGCWYCFFCCAAISYLYAFYTYRYLVLHVLWMFSTFWKGFRVCFSHLRLMSSIFLDHNDYSWPFVYISLYIDHFSPSF